MMLRLLVYPVYNAWREGQAEDLTQVCFRSLNVAAESAATLNMQAEYFCRLNGYYGYQLTVGKQVFENHAY